MLNISDHGITTVDRIGSFVTHHKVAVSRNGVWKFQVAVAQALFCHIGLFQKLFVDVHISFTVDHNGFFRQCNHALQQNLPLIIETYQITAILDYSQAIRQK